MGESRLRIAALDPMPTGEGTRLCVLISEQMESEMRRQGYVIVKRYEAEQRLMENGN